MIKRLGRKKELEARMEVLEIKMDKQAIGPRTKMVATYGGGTSAKEIDISDEEVEHGELRHEVRLLNAALNGISDIQQEIVKMKYIAKLEIDDWHIYEVQIPQKFHKYMSRATYFREKKEALKTMGRCLGYKLYKNDTPVRPQALK